MLNKKHLYLIAGTIIFVALLFIIADKEKEYINNYSNNDLNNNNNSGTTKVIDNKTVSGSSDEGNYYETDTTVKSEELENIEEKLQEEGRIEGTTIYFNKNGFKDSKKEITFKQNSNIKLEINAGDTGLKEGTQLNLLIPGAGVDALITVPGRYKYSMFFNKGGKQEIIITGKGLVNNKITKTITLR